MIMEEFQTLVFLHWDTQSVLMVHSMMEGTS